VQLSELGAEEPASAVGPVHLDLHSGPGLEAHSGVCVLVAGPDLPDPPDERGVGPAVAELGQLAVKRRGPKVLAALEPASGVGELGLGELRGTLPGAVPGNGL